MLCHLFLWLEPVTDTGVGFKWVQRMGFSRLQDSGFEVPSQFRMSGGWATPAGYSWNYRARLNRANRFGGGLQRGVGVEKAQRGGLTWPWACFSSWTTF